MIHPPQSAGVDDEEGLTAEELRQKYADLPQSTLVSDHESVASDNSESSDGAHIPHMPQRMGDQAQTAGAD
jgi:helicase SWR1